jgi:adenylate cyclase
MSDKYLYKNNGFIERIVGNAIVAIFGLNSAFHADEVCKAAISCIKNQKKVYNKFKTELNKDENVLKTSIGIASGKSSIGVIGSKYRLDFSAMGPVQNFASRLQPLAREFNSSIIISDATKSLLTKKFKLKEKQVIRIKGHDGEQILWELLP